MAHKTYKQMSVKEQNLFRRDVYLKRDFINARIEAIQYGREVEANAEYSLMIVDVIDRYVTLEKCI